MTEREYEKLKRDAKDRLDKAMKAAHAEYEREVSAIEVVWELSQQAGGSGQKTRKRVSSLDSHVRELVPGLGGEFTAVDVEKMLEREHPELNGGLRRKSVSSVLSRLAEEGKVAVAVEGAGRRPASYRVLGPSQTAGVAAQCE